MKGVGELKELNAVIQVCQNCGKVDVAMAHKKVCDPLGEHLRQENLDYYD